MVGRTSRLDEAFRAGDHLCALQSFGTHWDSPKMHTCVCVSASLMRHILFMFGDLGVRSPPPPGRVGVGLSEHPAGNGVFLYFLCKVPFFFGPPQKWAPEPPSRRSKEKALWCGCARMSVCPSAWAGGSPAARRCLLSSPPRSHASGGRPSAHRAVTPSPRGAPWRRATAGRRRTTTCWESCSPPAQCSASPRFLVWKRALLNGW